MLTPQIMAQMSDEHLIAALHAEHSDLTRTDTETELLKRFEAKCGATSDELLDLIDEYEIEADWLRDLLEAHPASIKNITEMLGALNDAEINTPAQLAEALNDFALSTN